MKHLVAFAIFAFCGMNISSAQHSQQLSRQMACEVLSIDDVARLLKTEANNLISEDMSFAEGKRRSICHYVVKGKVASYNMRLAWQSEKAVANGALVKRYERYLKNGEENMKQYTELQNDGKIQILYGAQALGGGMNHVIRKRYGNSAEAKIEVLLEEGNYELKDELLEIIQRIK